MVYLKKYWSYVLLVVFAVAAGISMHQCNLEKTLKEQNGVLLQDAKNGGETFKESVSKLGDSLNIQQQRIVSSQEQLKELGLANELKDHQIAQLQSRVAITEDVGFKKPTTVSFTADDTNKRSIVYLHEPDSASVADTIGCNCVEFPLVFDCDSQWYNISGMVIPTGIEFNHLEFKTAPTYELGFKKKTTIKEWFSRAEPIVVVTDKSPYATVTGMQNVVYQAPEKWYQTTGFKVGAGATAGAIVVAVLVGLLHR